MYSIWAIPRLAYKGKVGANNIPDVKIFEAVETIEERAAGAKSHPETKLWHRIEPACD